MPVVHRSNGFRVQIYTHDHIPPHVHVFRGGAEAVIIIEGAVVRDNRGMSGRDLRQAQEIVAQHTEFLLSEWHRLAPLP